MNPRFFSLFFLQELVGLDAPLTGLLRLRPGKPHLNQRKGTVSEIPTIQTVTGKLNQKGTVRRRALNSFNLAEALTVICLVSSSASS